MTARVRQIRADEGPRLRALRLRALADSPWAFGSTLAREAAFLDDVWQEVRKLLAEREYPLSGKDAAAVGQGETNLAARLFSPAKEKAPDST